jgi:hypothetical protein
MECVPFAVRSCKKNNVSLLRFQTVNIDERNAPTLSGLHTLNVNKTSKKSFEQLLSQKTIAQKESFSDLQEMNMDETCSNKHYCFIFMFIPCVLTSSTSKYIHQLWYIL